MGKWVEVRDVNRAATDVAAEILQARIEHVEQMLPLAAHAYQDDVEHVHQLRVACRRAGAAVEAFRPLLGRKSKSLRKWLRNLRRAAGPARDADVLLQRLRSDADRTPAYLVARVQHLRAGAQQKLLHADAEAKEGALGASIDRCLAALSKRGKVEPPVAQFDDYARGALRSASKKMFQLAGIEQATVAQLHQLRISGKRLRYSIELFHEAVSPDLRNIVYPLVEKIQSRLGKLNDHATAQALFQSWIVDLPADERAAQLAARVVEEYSEFEAVRAEFLKWWTPKRVVELEIHLSEVLQRRR